MNRRVAQLKKLQRLTAARMSLAQAAFLACTKQEAALRNGLALLKTQHPKISGEGEAMDAASLAGADVRWQQWAETRRAAINTELAQVLSRKIECQRALRKAFGKDQVAKALLSKNQTSQTN